MRKSPSSMQFLETQLVAALAAASAGSFQSVKIRVENQQEEEEQREQRSGHSQQQEKKNRKSVLPCRAQPNAATYHSCQSGQDRQPWQNVE